MTRRRRTLILAAACVSLAIVGGIAWGQPWMRRRGTPGMIPDDRAGIPNWSNDARYKKDVFTFCRVQYDSGYRGGRRGYRGGLWGGWLTDYPDSDLNFSFRLQQLTSLRVNPNPVTRRLTDPDLGDFPFLYMIEPGNGGLLFSEEEVKALRKYLLNGGFLMVDDFWGDEEYEVFYCQIKRVFPDREPRELDLDHEIFRIVYRLKEKPQVPSIHSWEGPGSAVTWEWRHNGDTRTVHYRGIFDDKGRMMVLICHNTDLGDGWEREGENIDYFHEFSEKKSYPMGINIVTYAMTH